ncbi:MAG TPA: oxidoreductase [Devosia sp.]|nr:oxidoreductase [Devosia sp.]
MADITDQRGRVALVTGASNGIGLATALELARHGAHVIVHARDPGRGGAALERIQGEVPDARLELQLADFADLKAVAEMAERMRVTHAGLDLIINNAGTMMAPPRPTAQHHELHFGVNYLAHFALTLPLLPLLAGRPDARVVNVSSIAHRHGRMDFDNLPGAGRWPYQLYARSKLAMTYFGVELDRRLRATGSPILSVLAHPGFAGTNLAEGMAPGVTGWWMRYIFPRFGQSLVDGARPTLFAATQPGVTSGEFYGPDGLGELKGAPRRVKISARAMDGQVGKRLWVESERLTGVTMPAIG